MRNTKSSNTTGFELKISKSSISPLVIVLVSLVAVFIQVNYISSPLDNVYSDMRGYVERGWKIVAGEPFISFDAFYPPGMAYFFAIVFTVFGFSKGLPLAAFLQALMLAGSNLCFYFLGRELFGSRKIAFFLALVFAVYPPIVTTSSFFVSEPLFIFLLLFSNYFFVRMLRRNTASHSSFFVLGLLLASAILVKGQGLSLIPGLLAVALFPQFKHIRKFLLTFLCALALPISFQFAINSAILGKPSYFLAANDSYNTYLGQSRHKALGCLDRDKGYFFIFHNNNAAFHEYFNPPAIAPVSILDREYFKNQTYKLWHDQPQQQFFRSLESVFELFSTQMEWPGRNLISHRPILKQSKLLLYIILIPLSFISIVFCLRRKRFTWQIIYLLLPMAGISAICFVTMGQPRYLLPFLYNAALLSTPILSELLSSLRSLFLKVKKK